MGKSNRRDFMRGAIGAAGVGAALATFPPSIRRALAIPANRRTGTLDDVEHIVVLMQENRSFDHYFGTLRGVRGFGDRFPIPVPDAVGIANKTVWYQSHGGEETGGNVVTPFHLDTRRNFDCMRVQEAPHAWPDAQHAWADGRLTEWPRYKADRALGYYDQRDLPFQFALAEAFTLCDAYHCSFQGGTNPNRCFQWTGSNDPERRGHGPVLFNELDNLETDPDGGYTYTTYCERLEAAGIRWQIYQDMGDNFTDNPLAGFRSFRDAYRGRPGSIAALKERGLTTRDLEQLKADVINGRLPQVSFIIATADGSEHPEVSSPAQGAEYTAQVLDALTANPTVWSKTVLFLNFDESDGFFDHVPPPAVPSYLGWDGERGRARLAGDSTVETTGEYHEVLSEDDADELRALQHKPYGLGPRVPLYVISPFSKGGWVNSQLFDHTSVIRFIERRFGVVESNISAWRRAVCGDLTSAFDFSDPDASDFYEGLPDTSELAERARALPDTCAPPRPALPELPRQNLGIRPSRALPYELHVNAVVSVADAQIELTFANSGRSGAVFHVYDRKHLERVPRRYTVEAGKQLLGVWETRLDGGAYDLWVLGPNGFHRHFTGPGNAREAGLGAPRIQVRYDPLLGNVSLRLHNDSGVACTFVLRANAYYDESPVRVRVAPNAEATHTWLLRQSGHWYDFTATLEGLPGYSRRFAGRVETARDSISDPALGGRALGEQLVIA